MGYFYVYTVSTVIMNFVILWTFHGIVFIIYLVNFLLTHQQFKKLKWDKNLDKNLVFFFNQTWLNSMHWEITVLPGYICTKYHLVKYHVCYFTD